MTQTLTMAEGSEVVIQAPGGRVIHLYLHNCESCTSLDVWTDAGNKVEEVSARTGDTTRAPVGVFAFAKGSRYSLSSGIPADPRCFGHEPVSTAVLIWNERNTDG